jgi:hypothetical protein
VRAAPLTVEGQDNSNLVLRGLKVLFRNYSQPLQLIGYFMIYKNYSCCHARSTVIKFFDGILL